MWRRNERSDIGEAGYFLTDALVGLFVLASVTGSLMVAFGLAKVTANRADQTAKALVIAKACIEEGGFEGHERIFTIGRVDYRQMRSVEVQKGGEKDAVQLIQIACTVEWIERNAPASIRLERIEAGARST